MSGLDALYAGPQISTDTDGRHFDEAGIEYLAVEYRGELTYVVLGGDS